MGIKKKQEHLLADLWESYPDAISRERTAIEVHDITKNLIDAFAIGPYYYFIVNMYDYSVGQFSDNILAIHGGEKFPVMLKDFLNLVHPDDQGFVLRAEDATLKKIAEIGFENHLYLKTSYNIRMRIHDGSYHLFHHQSIRLAKDESGRISTVLNIHTDIHHITKTNNYIALVTGVGERNDYFQINLSLEDEHFELPKLSKREMEVLGLLAQGLTSKDIADRLYISLQTVHVHRKNLLKKTKANNLGALIKYSLEVGLV